MKNDKSTKTKARVIIIGLAVTLLVLIIALCYFIFPSKVIETYSDEAVKKILTNVVKAPLPENINDFHGEAIFVFTGQVWVRFSTTQSQFENFLKESPFLPDVLKTDIHTLSKYQFGKDVTKEYNWWRPDKLTHNILGEKLAWHDKPMNVDFYIMAGKENPEDNELIVYMYFISEEHAAPYKTIPDANNII